MNLFIQSLMALATTLSSAVAPDALVPSTDESTRIQFSANLDEKLAAVQPPSLRPPIWGQVWAQHGPWVEVQPEIDGQAREATLSPLQAFRLISGTK